MQIHLHMFICTNTYISIHLHIYTCIYTYIYADIYIYIYLQRGQMVGCGGENGAFIADRTHHGLHKISSVYTSYKTRLYGWDTLNDVE